MSRPTWPAAASQLFGKRWIAAAGIVVSLTGCGGGVEVAEGADAGGAGGAAETADAAAGGGAGGASAADVPDYVAGSERPSCKPAQLVCAGQGCCASQRVPGGTFNRYNDPKYPATLSDFHLDIFEVTVGRMRAFVEAVEAGWRPAPGSGASPHVSGTGWDPEWSSNYFDHLRAMLAPEFEEIFPETTWTDEPAGNENMPIAYVVWSIAQGFCIWDGGRLPTIAEWHYAATGGDEQRTYPWGEEYPTPEHANIRFDTDEPWTERLYVDVGSFPKGLGKWGHLDMNGSRREWIMDSSPYEAIAGQEEWPEPIVPCHDCMRPPMHDYPMLLDACVRSPPKFIANESKEYTAIPEQFDPAFGFRCTYATAVTEAN